MSRSEIAIRCAETYERHKNLKVVGQELGIPWQTVYVHLKTAGVAVTGDKARYGSNKDRLAARAETEFGRLVPGAMNQNDRQFQSKIDFVLGNIGIDIKASTLKQGSRRFPSRRWSFSIKKQEMNADFIVCFGYLENGEYKTFLLPGELIRKYQTVSICEKGGSKWYDYEVRPEELNEFFASLSRS